MMKDSLLPSLVGQWAESCSLSLCCLGVTHTHTHTHGFIHAVILFFVFLKFIYFLYIFCYIVCHCFMLYCLELCVTCCCLGQDTLVKEIFNLNEAFPG